MYTHIYEYLIVMCRIIHMYVCIYIYISIHIYASLMMRFNIFNKYRVSCINRRVIKVVRVFIGVYRMYELWHVMHRE